MRNYSHLLVFISLVFANHLGAQINDQIDYNERYGGTQQGGTDSLATDLDITPDTFNFHYFYPANPEEEFGYADTTIYHFQYHDPVRLQQWDYGMTGNLGGAHFPFVYQPPIRRGFEVGYRQFDLYKIPYDEFAFYRLRKAFTRLHFTQGDSQEDTYTQAKFTRNFANNINLSLDYKRINQNGQYQSQNSENTSLAVGIWYKSPSRRYDAFISYISNAIFQNENGGINLDGINETNIKQAFSVPVKLNSGIANTAHTDRAIHYQHRFLFNKQRATPPKDPNTVAFPLLKDSIKTNNDSIKITIDTVTTTIDSLAVTKDTLTSNPLDFPTNINSLILNVDSLSAIKDSIKLPIKNNASTKQATPFKKRKRDFAFSHHGSFQVAKYKFSDTSPDADSSFYQNLQVDNRGLRYFIRDRNLENSFTLNTSKLQKGVSTDLQKQKDFFEVGIRHSIHFLFQEPQDTIINNLFLQGRWDFAPGERLKIKTFADLGLIDNAGDYRLNGELFFNLNNAGNIKATAMHQSYSPTLLQYRHYVSQQLLWQNNFEKTFETSISLSYKLPRFHLELIGQYHLIDHFIFYNADALPEQYNSPLSIGQLTLKKDFRFWNFVFENNITAQQISKSVLRLPELYSKHSLYFDGKIFKGVLNIHVGFDLRINTPYEAEGYQPLIGQFYLQEYEADEEVKWYPDIDFFINFRVKNFRFFVKQENIFGYFTDDFHFQVKDYPLVYPSLRFGVGWQFLD